VLFSGDDADKATRSLSGGETARLLLAALMLKRDNLLVLDEPTNHLDLEGREALLQALREYEGTLVFVSHDRHFVSSLARRILALTPQGYEDFHGTYEEYLAKEGADYLSAEQAAPSRMARANSSVTGAAVAGAGGNGAGIPATTATPQDFESRKAAKREAARLAKQVSRLEIEIQELEARIASADRRFAEPGYFERTAWDEVSRAEGERAAWRAELHGKMEAWESLSAQLERLGEAS
jgi:ABC-type multidrug transport system ATPase subunit